MKNISLGNLICTLVITLLSQTGQAAALKDTDVVFSASSNYCHPVESRYRDRMKLDKYGNKVFDSLKKCIEAGGVLVPYLKALLTIASPEESEEIRSSEENVKSNKTTANKFFGINWGLGFAYTDIGKNKVSDVTINNIEVPSVTAGEPPTTINTVSVNKSKSVGAVAMLETHYFFGKDNKPSDYETTWAHGPFTAIGIAGEDGVDPLSIFGFGWMFGFKRDNGSSYNVGLGYFVDTSVNQLRRGVIDGAVTDFTDPKKLQIEKDEDGYMIMFSANF